jgi:paraquat-inducible protein A
MLANNPAPVACRECDALMREPSLEPGGTARCIRCGAVLFRRRDDSLDRTLAWLLAAAVLLGIALGHPLVRLDANGITTSATLLELAAALRDQGMPSVGALVLATTVLVPSLQLTFALCVLVPLKLGYVPDALPFAFRTVSKIWPWGMLDVFVVGSLVSIVKLRDMASVELGLGFYAVAGYIVAISAAVSTFEARAIWDRVAELSVAGEARRA